MSPLKLFTPVSRGQSVWAYLSSFGGGLVAGDETHLRVRIDDQARCFLSTQASTKVYRNPLRRAAGHKLWAELGAESLLVLAPDPVQAFADSLYAQHQEFRLHGQASLVLVDWCCGGRTACGERWAFSRFASRNEIFVDGQLAFLDSLLLDPADGPLTEAGRMGRFNTVALLVLVGPALTDATERLLDGIKSRPVERQAALVCSASPIRGGAVLRIAGEQVEAVGREVQQHLHPVRALLGDDPWARKW